MFPTYCCIHLVIESVEISFIFLQIHANHIL